LADSAKFSPGDILDGRYRIDALIAVGGMGAVYAGTHLLLKKRIAIKVLRSDLQSKQTMVDRFQREAIAASGIGHENIVSVTDMGTTADGGAYLVMELLEGQNLADLIETDAPLSVALSCDICLEILSGIAAAHHAGIVHRDLKPDNIYMCHRPLGRDRVKILDFGVSRLASASPTPDIRLTTTGMIMGTPRYMSPEQARGETKINHATDIYATGVILYEMLSREVPYGAHNYNVLVHKILSAETVPLEQYRPDLPRALIETVERAMALDPADRYATAEEFAIAIAPFSSDPKQAPTLPLTLPRARKSTGGGGTSLHRVETAATLAEEPSGQILAATRRTPPLHSRGPGQSGLHPPSPTPGDSGLYPTRTSFADEARDVERQPGGDTRAWRFGLFLTLVLVGGAAAFFFFKQRSDREGEVRAPVTEAAPKKEPKPVAEKEPEPVAEKEPKPVAEKEPEPVAEKEPVSKKKPARKVSITFRVTPADARITIDGETLSGSVYKTEHSQVAASVVITAPGYMPFARSVSLDSNETIKVSLKKTPQAPVEEPEPDLPAPDEPTPSP
jgi:serine/threonine protein kinase